MKKGPARGRLPDMAARLVSEVSCLILDPVAPNLSAVTHSRRGPILQLSFQHLVDIELPEPSGTFHHLEGFRGAINLRVTVDSGGREGLPGCQNGGFDISVVRSGLALRALRASLAQPSFFQN
jgi:hypothetical protein